MITGQKERAHISYNVLGRAPKRLEVPSALGLQHSYAFIELFKFTACIINGYMHAVWFEIYVKSVAQTKFPPIFSPTFPGASKLNIRTPFVKMSFTLLPERRHDFFENKPLYYR